MHMRSSCRGDNINEYINDDDDDDDDGRTGLRGVSIKKFYGLG